MKLTFRDIVKFGILVGLTGIFLDAVIAHGVIWENDPYWTYWLTKTFLIITVFILGTAFLGIGILRGALITAVFTVILQTYYSWFAPVGLPQEPMWFIVSDNWKIGYITHFLAIYSGYIFSLWVWKRNTTTIDITASKEAIQLAIFSLIIAVVILILDGIITQRFLLNSFPGITYFIQHLLIAFIFITIWTAFVGFDKAGLVVGSVMLALLWIAYGMFLGPVGLPGPSPHYLGYSDLWYKSFPGVLISSLIAFSLLTRFTPKVSKLPLVTILLFLLTISMPEFAYAAEGVPATVVTSGKGKMVVGVEPYDLSSTDPMNGSIQMQVVNAGDRWSPLMNVDKINVTSEFTSGGSRYRVIIDKPMVKHPMGKYTTWFGVVYRQRMHGLTGIGTDKLPDVVADVAVWGFAQVEKDGEMIAKMAPAHIMVMQEGPIKGITLEVDTENKALQGVDNGYLNVMWPNINTFNLSASEENNRRLLGWSVFIVAGILFGYLINREQV